MSEKPILFSAPMVRAVLEGRKTQTRRIVKGADEAEEINHHTGREWHSVYQKIVTGQHGSRELEETTHRELCPYGQPGDRLWVRETWIHYHTINHRVRMDGGSFSEVSDGYAAYKADGFDSIQDFKDHIRLTSDSGFEGIEVWNDQFRPSIHMPRWASRITLEVVSVKVERLQDISEEDAMAEGILKANHGLDKYNQPHPKYYWKEIGAETPNVCHQQAKYAFANLWQSINGHGSWEANPWVWVVEFEKEAA